MDGTVAAFQTHSVDYEGKGSTGYSQGHVLSLLPKLTNFFNSLSAEGKYESYISLKNICNNSVILSLVEFCC